MFYGIMGYKQTNNSRTKHRTGEHIRATNQSQDRGGNRTKIEIKAYTHDMTFLGQAIALVRDRRHS